MMNIPGDLIIAIDRDIRFAPKRLPVFIGCRDMNGDVHSLKQMIFEETIDHGTIADIVFMKETYAQDLINDLYRTGFRPSDEIKKDDLIKTLQKEIDKRDKMIEALMQQFVFKGNDTAGRKIIT